MIKHPLIQTIYPIYAKPDFGFNHFKLNILKLNDGDELELYIYDEFNLSPTIILFHGLTGSIQSHYIKRVTKQLIANKFNFCLVNMRGAGEIARRPKKSYHSGLSSDVNEIIQYVQSNHQNSEIILCGFSLGGNLVLKYAIDFPNNHNVKKIIAVCPPCDLKSTVEKMAKNNYSMFDKYFTKEILRLARNNNHEISTKLNVNSTLFDVDHYYTAAQWDFDGALDYYQKASTYKEIHQITYPTSILIAQDDPVIDARWLVNALLPKNIRITSSIWGGHVGFFESLNLNQNNFLEKYILNELNF